MKLSKITIVMSAAFVLTACETTPEMTPDGKTLLTELGQPAAPMEAMQVPATARAGEKSVWFQKGEEHETEVTKIDENSITLLNSAGCSYTDPVFSNNLHNLSPSLEWENCTGGSSGHSKVTVDGELFPISLGTKVVYTVKGTSTAGNWTGNWSDRRVCKVSDQVRIETLGGEYDTWKIECKDKNNKRTYYISPELGHPVAFKRKHSNDRRRSYTSVFLRDG